MIVNRRKNLERRILLACYVSSMVGVAGVTGFFYGAFNITVAHVKQIIVPTIIVLLFDGGMQVVINKRLLKRFLEWYSKGDGAQDLELSLAAQTEMLNYPQRGSAASLILWVISGGIVAILLRLFRSVFSPRQLFNMWMAISSGGALSMLFQFYFYKRIFRRDCSDLMSVRSGLHSRQNISWLNMRSKWLINVLVILVVGMVFTGFMGGARASESIMRRAAILMSRVGEKVTKKKSAQAEDLSIDRYLEDASGALGMDMFVFNEQGKALYGKLPAAAPPEIVKEYLKEYRSWITSIFSNEDYNSRNISGSSDELVWIEIQKGQYIGTLFNYSDIVSDLRGFKITVFMVALFFVTVALFVAYFAASDFSEPMAYMLKITDKIANGDLTENVNLLSEDEIGRLATALQVMTEELRSMISRVNEAAGHVGKAAHDIIDSQAKVSQGAELQVSAIEETGQIARDVNQIVNDISENIDTMAINAKESASAIIEIEALANELSDNVKELSNAVETTTSAIYEMNASIKDIDDGVDELARVSEDTASSTLQMNQTIKEVEEHARETLALSEQVSSDAVSGVNSVQSAISGIGRIEEGVREASEVINNLGKHAEEIGLIVNVITDIADQTNLLALNAAIIAAQAGERGRSFGVVADEIKKLADRTTMSTKEIRELITAVQTNSQRAVRVMEAEGVSVEDGVNLAFQAGQALEKIMKSSRTSADMANRIASATTEQAASSKRVTDAITAIADRVAKIASAIREQTRGVEQITSASGEMRDIAPSVSMKAQKQAEGGKQITLAMENITEMVSYVLKSQQRQQEQSERILMAMNQIKSILDENSQTVAQLDSTVQILSTQSDSLSSEVKRFKLPGCAT